MFIRLIIAFVVIVAAVALVRHLRTRIRTPTRPAIDAKTVRCEHCQVYLPRQDAVSREGHHYCSPGHADAGPE